MQILHSTRRDTGNGAEVDVAKEELRSARPTDHDLRTQAMHYATSSDVFVVLGQCAGMGCSRHGCLRSALEDGERFLVDFWPSWLPVETMGELWTIVPPIVQKYLTSMG